MFSTAFLLFLIIDPFGNVVVLNSLLANFTPAERRWIVLREAAIATAILLIAALAGESMLAMLGLEQYSIRLAGGVILFLIAMGMVFPGYRIWDEPEPEAPLVVPIAVPFIAGPSAISMVIILAKQHSTVELIGAILAAAAGTTAILAASSKINAWLGRRGSAALERLMGILLIMIAIQMILDGIEVFACDCMVPVPVEVPVEAE